MIKLNILVVTLFITTVIAQKTVDNQCADIKDRYKNLLESEKWADSLFLVGKESDGTYFYAHRLIMAMASPVFSTLLYRTDEGTDQCPEPGPCGLPPDSYPSGQIKDERDAIVLPHISANIFKIMLEYIYTDNLVIESFDTACDLAYLSQEFQLSHLLDKCLDIIFSRLQLVDYANVYKLYELGKYLNNSTLIDKIIPIIQSNTKAILLKNSFINMKIETVVDIFSMKFLNIDSEVDLLDAAIHYSKAQIIRQRKTESIDYNSASSNYTIRDVVMKIRFLTMSAYEFIKVSKNDLLTEAETQTIFEKISMERNDLPMPNGFSTSTMFRKFFYYKFDFEKTSILRYNSDMKHWYYLRFKVDAYICVISVQVETQLGDPNKSYDEFIYVKIFNARSTSSLVTKNVDWYINYNDTIYVTFDHPYCLNKDQQYDISVKLFTTGIYPQGRGASLINQDGVTIQVDNGSGFTTAIRGIKYQMYKKYKLGLTDQLNNQYSSLSEKNPTEQIPNIAAQNNLPQILETPVNQDKPLLKTNPTEHKPNLQKTRVPYIRYMDRISNKTPPPSYKLQYIIGRTT